MTREEIEESYEGIIFYDGFDEAIVGLGTRFGMVEEVVVYDKNKIINIIMESFDDEDVELYDDVTGLDEDEIKFIIEGTKYSMALEHFDYNIIGGWVGDRTPMFIELEF